MSVWVVVQSVCMHVNKCFCLKCSTTVIDVTILVEGKKNKVGCLRNCGKRFMFYVGIQQVARKNTFTCRAIFGGNSIHNTNTATWVHQFSSVTQSCPTLGDPMDCSTPGFPVHHQLPELTQTHVHCIGDDMQPSHPLSSPSHPPSIFPSIRVFSNESVLHIRWPKYWSSSISPSNEYSGLISFRIGWFGLLSPRDSQQSSPTPQFKSINSLALSFLYGPTHIHTWLLEKP